MCAVPNMAVFWFPAMLLTYFLNDFEMVPVAPIITDITLLLNSDIGIDIFVNCNWVDTRWQ
jgi:hypothetical protein